MACGGLCVLREEKTGSMCQLQWCVGNLDMHQVLDYTIGHIV